MYKFIKKEEDIYVLKYKDKELEFKVDINVAKEFESINIIARTQLMKDLTKQGITKKELTVVREENGKTYYDNTNYLDLEETYIQQATVDIISKITNKKFGYDYMELIQDIGILENQKEIERFTVDFLSILQGKEAVDNTPSKKEQ